MKVKGYMYPQMKKPVGMLIYSVLIGGACTSIVFVVINLTFSDSKDFHSTYLPSIIFSLINVVIPKIVSMVR
jgi:hypothetical protein